jgi:branched-chain amino acid transport system ATP-binding protein
MHGGNGQEPVLRLDHVTRHYGGVCAVDGVSLEVPAGERHVIIGPNGAGKTTLFKLISRLEPVSGGRIELFGRNITRLTPHRVARLGLGRTYQITQLFPQLTVIENVMLAVLGSRPGKFVMLRSALRQGDDLERAEQTLERVGLGGLGGHVAAELAHGQQRQLEVGLALAADPKVVLLDEPGAGLASDDRGRIRDLVSGLPEQITVLLIEHDMELALGLADRVSCLHNGALVASGTPEQMKEDERVQEIYLGGAAR